MSSLLLMSLFGGCFLDGSPYPVYWEPSEESPVVKAATPSAVSGLVGKESVVLVGENLETTATVVIGGRNAEVVSVESGRVEVLIPPGPPGGGTVDVGLVTDHGQVVLEDGFRYNTTHMEFVENEVASVAMVRSDCPSVAWSLWMEDLDWWPVLWCGFDLSEFYSVGWWGSGGGRGMAGDLSGLGSLSGLGARGEAAFWGPGERRPDGPPELYGNHADSEVVRVTTERDFAWDLQVIEDRIEEIERTYPWTPAIQSIQRPVLALFDDETCWLEDLTVLEANGQVLNVSDSVSGATGGWLGLSVLEEYDGETYVEEAWTGSTGLAEGASGVVGTDAGAVLSYDSYSGYFLGTGEAGLEGASAFSPSVGYTVSVEREGQTLVWDKIEGPDLLEIQVPDLMMGDVDVDLEAGLQVRWTPGADEDLPSIVVVELRVYDADIDDPNWMTEMYRLVSWTDDSAGRLTLDAEDLQRLPTAANKLSRFDDLMGYWAELSVVRHQLRKVEVSGGDLVVDFVHAIGSPVTLSRGGEFE